MFVQWGRVCMGLGAGMGDWVGDGMLAGGWRIFAQKSESRGVNLTREIPLNNICENLNILLKK